MLFIFAGIISLYPGIEEPYNGDIDSIDFIKTQLDLMQKMDIKSVETAKLLLLNYRFNCQNLGIEGLTGIYTLQDLYNEISKIESLSNLNELINSFFTNLFITGKFFYFISDVTIQLMKDVTDQTFVTSISQNPGKLSQYFFITFIYVNVLPIIYYITKFISNITTRRSNNFQNQPNIIIQLPPGMTTQQVVDYLRNLNDNKTLYRITEQNTPSTNLIMRGGGGEIEINNNEMTNFMMKFFNVNLFVDILMNYIETNGLSNGIDGLNKIMDNELSIRNINYNPNDAEKKLITFINNNLETGYGGKKGRKTRRIYKAIIKRKKLRKSVKSRK
jgi:hypothetical protein